MTMDIAEFLLARIAEDEDYAYHALGVLGIETEWHDVEGLRGRGLARGDAQHVNRWSPRRVLTQCEAKRRIVELHASLTLAPTGYNSMDGWVWHDNPPVCLQCAPGEEGEDWRERPPVGYPCETLRVLAGVYADHPDYDEAWRVDLTSGEFLQTIVCSVPTSDPGSLSGFTYF